MSRGSVLALCLPLLLGACFERTRPTLENAIRPVQTVRVSLGRADETRAYPGTIRPRREADIALRAGGRIIARDVDVGTKVQAGEVLLRLDPTDLGLTVRAAEADLAGARAQSEQAQADAARSHSLLAKGWVSAATNEVRQATALSAADKVASATAALTLARNKLDYAVLRAPAAGVVTATMADPGTVVSEGQPVLRLAEAGAIEVEVAVPEAAVADAAHGRATVEIWARPDAPLSASLREMSPDADQKLRTYTARYAIAEPPAWLAIGMTATVRLAQGSDVPVAFLPASALADRGDGPMVWVVDESGGLQVRPVQVRALRQDQALVTGLHDGELVVSLGVQKLDPAARVRVADIRPLPQ